MPANAELLPGLRAAIDRFWLDGANLVYVASLLEGELAERRCQATGWTMRQTVAHLAESPRWYGEALAHFVAGKPGFPSDPNPTDRNAAHATRHATTPIADLLALHSANRTATLLGLRGLTPDEQAGSLGRATVIATAEAWSLHYAHHALDFLEAVPEVQLDPLLVNWAFWADFPDDAWNARRDALLKAVRKAIAEDEKKQRKRRKKE